LSASLCVSSTITATQPRPYAARSTALL
jgi:hypothetical protein